MFLTALAPNLLAVELVQRTAQIEISWVDWFMYFAPVGILLLATVPLLVYWIYPPEVTEGAEVPGWAAKELEKMGPLSNKEITLGVLVVLALLLWIFGGNIMEATTAAIAVISLMLILGVVTWDDITANKAAWNTLAWFATLVALADGLTRVGFVKWFATSMAGHLSGTPAAVAVAMLLLINFFGHYLFASVTAHVTAMIPVLLAVASTIPGVNMHTLSLGLCLQLGIMGIITPYATGPSPVYYGSGYLPAADYWRLGAIFGVIFFAAFLAIGVPWMLTIR
jgi:L-tartrate/succinate antiporter